MRTKVARRVQGHRISWFVYASGQKMRHEVTMREGWFAWDAECECGWESRTGGAIRASVERNVRDHKFDVTGDWRML